MNPRIPLPVALLAAVAVTVYFFLSSNPPLGNGDAADAPEAAAKMHAARGARSAGGNATGEDAATATDSRSGARWERLNALANGGAARDLFPEISPEDIARFLAKHGETPANLIAAFEKTQDRALLDRALELFPHSPLVLMVALTSIPASAAPKPGETYQPDAQRTAFIERFKAADPNNPLPWIYSAQELFKAKQTGDAVTEVRAALERPAFYTYATERMASAQQLYEDLGLSQVEAGLLTMAGLTLSHMTAAQQASRSLMEWQKSAGESGDAAAADDALRLTYGLGRTFATPEASRTLIGQLVGISMEYRALKTLPPDAQPGWLSVPPAQRMAEMEAQKENVSALVRDAGIEWLIGSEDENLLAEYLRRNRDDGEFSALMWLKAQRK